MTQNSYNNIDINKMSIEDIKRLTDELMSTPNMYTLTGATPLINDVAAYWHAPTGTGAVLVLWRNTGGSGWVRIEGWGKNSSTSPDVKLGEFANCFDPILPLGYLQQISTNTLYTYGFGRTYYCPNGATENCVYPATCSAPIITATYPTAKDSPFMGYDSATPTIPPSLLVTTGGSGQLIISWGVSTGPTIFAYSVRVTGSDKTIFGHVPASIRNVTIGGLTNNYLYNVEVRATSTSNVVSAQATGSGTPMSACPIMGIPILTIP